MLHIVESTKPLERLASDLTDAVVKNKFGVLGVHDLKQTMAKKGVAFERECRIFEVCNPHQAKKVLEGEPRDLNRAAVPDLRLRRGWSDEAGHDQADRDAEPVPEPRAQARRRGGRGRDRADHGRGGPVRRR